MEKLPSTKIKAIARKLSIQNGWDYETLTTMQKNTLFISAMLIHLDKEKKKSNSSSNSDVKYLDLSSETIFV